MEGIVYALKDDMKPHPAFLKAHSPRVAQSGYRTSGSALANGEAAELVPEILPAPHALAAAAAWEARMAERTTVGADDYRRTFGGDGLIARAKQDLIETRFNPRKPLKLKTHFRGFRILFASGGAPVSVVFEHPSFSSDICQLAA